MVVSSRTAGGATGVGNRSLPVSTNAVARITMAFDFRRIIAHRPQKHVDRNRPLRNAAGGIAQKLERFRCDRISCESWEVMDSSSLSTFRRRPIEGKGSNLVSRARGRNPRQPRTSHRFPPCRAPGGRWAVGADDSDRAGRATLFDRLRWVADEEAGSDDHAMIMR